MQKQVVRHKLEYIWLDGTEDTQGLRSKTLLHDNFSGNFKDAIVWCYDGSSTNQAKGGSSDLQLQPVYCCVDPQRKNGYLVMCEVMNPDGTPHSTNYRAKIAEKENDTDFWFGWEQEYCFWDLKTNNMLGFPQGNYFPSPQGPYYCSVGAGKAIGREIVEEHLDACIDAGLGIEGINAEVMKGQWEYQVFAKGAKDAADQLWVSRYLLERIGEKYNVKIEWHPKPVKGDWNGSGMHANFSNKLMRECGDRKVFANICEHFGTKVKEHMCLYGAYNDQRLTGKHETQSIDSFSYGESDRGASIRIPIQTVNEGYKGRLEDRRVASNADPYAAAHIICQSTEEACLKMNK